MRRRVTRRDAGRRAAVAVVRRQVERSVLARVPTDLEPLFAEAAANGGAAIGDTGDPHPHTDGDGATVIGPDRVVADRHGGRGDPADPAGTQFGDDDE